MKPHKVLIIEDSTFFCDYVTQLVKIIGLRAYVRAYAGNGKAGFLTDLRSRSPDLVLLGSSVPEGQRRAFVEIVEREKQGLPILCIGNGEDTMHGAKIRATANISFLPSHFDGHDLKLAIDKLTEESQDSDYKKLDSIIIGRTPAMVEIKRHILRLGKSDLTVLITGETGTGKEVVARAIHNFSSRADKAFVKLNCAAVPTNLVESELFGFEKGAFTGAFNKKPGKFELAHTGTILLDEISETPLPMQAKLLQVLQDNEFSSLGSTTDTKIDARVMAATNNNLSEMVSQGQLRSDLYWRLNVVSIHIPPLRDRKQDMDLLCRHFLKKYAGRYDREHASLSDQVREQFYEYAWPGNIRELENVIQSFTVLGGEESFYEKMGNCGLASAFLNGKKPLTTGEGSGTVPPGPVGTRSLKKVCKEAARKAETKAIVDVLFHTQWNRRKAAVLLKTSYRTLLSKIKEYEIEQKPVKHPRVAMSAILRKPRRITRRGTKLDTHEKHFANNSDMDGSDLAEFASGFGT